ncbi:MAG: dihydroorotate dehydrogenase electron transfer subunit [Coriobacteriales bacterium]|jgi:dihydroorotate dehydrogenase electron transfer subunit|nr:dihydroorotate dehydrogenase electron transfer subunit [Coriobacteriales bacterium]
MISEQATVIANSELSGGLRQIVLRAPGIATSTEPGQFLHLLLSGHGDHLLRRPFSIHDVYADKHGDFSFVSVVYQVVGSGTALLAGYSSGAVLDVLGPIGRPWQPPLGAKRALVVGGGVGFAALTLLVGSLQAWGTETQVLLGARDKTVALSLLGGGSSGSYRSYALRDIPTPPNTGYSQQVATDDGSYGHHGLVTELSAVALADGHFDYVATCGPEAMMRIVAAQAAAAGASGAASLERRMACGVGACLSCVVQTASGQKRACVDGPVFDVLELADWGLAARSPGPDAALEGER